MMAAQIRSEWRPALSVSVAATWTRATVLPPDTSSAWNFSSRLIRSVALRLTAIQPKHPTSRTTHGVVRPRKVVQLLLCKPQSKLNALPASRWWSRSGNSGPGCFTVVDPPSIYDASYTVGALTTDTDNIASFSSRGPVSADASNRMKPDITAPGTNTRSCLNNSDSAYGTLSGTSMATPHVAGGVALLWSARPEFRHNIDATEGALNNSAAIF
jgi:subtilase family protein